MRQWLVVVPPDRYGAERLYHHDTLELSGGDQAELALGDRVVLAAGDPLVVFGLGRVTAPRRSWLVGVELPIEAGSPAEAVRQFWSYVTQLGPRELPAFVSPADDELAMQAYVLGEEANLDPEEEE